MICDAHLHLFRSGYRRFDGASPLGPASDVDAYEELRAAHGISRGLVVCYEGDDIDPTNNAYVREVARDRPWISSVAFVTPVPAPSPGHIRKLLDEGHVGIAVYLPDPESAHAVCGWQRPVWDALRRVNAVVSFNAGPEAISHLKPLIDASPECAFLFSHLGLPGRQNAMPSASRAAQRLAPLLQLAACPNAGVKISGLYAIDPVPPHRFARPFLDVVLRSFAPSNLHWGSDFSPALGFVRFADTLLAPGLEISSHARRMISGQALLDKLYRVRA